MKPQSPLITLRDLAQDAVEQATRQLGQVRKAQQAAEQQLSMLLNYQDEYRQKLNNQLSGGMESSNWQNYQQFIGTLEQAIAQHRQQLTQWGEKVDHAMKQWQDKQQRLNAFETLHTRAQSAELQLENKRDQKLMDEFAQRSAQRNIHQ
ncbi:Flagellar fliJ protein [Serratia liquefaciens]|mgnify:FL=1|jgi:flagellar protein FliJ|uniref:Flagellar FliJ protein n=1 Tax=Serratia liquefaciens TaxID=614 RepID=A0A379YU04_SERLI|nr:MULTISPECIES: flagellar export protein FliJ [Serratia]AGQ31748.1 flagellar biosynthesis chaperone [Serratia liquefaciens ATCC 27592]AMH01593.1 flagella biosynthesis chaperone FliJ [Serratia liquefaciens]AYO38706.1 flagella biosynthesis chaperone FliJ [Serratia sp. P2ACOL2]MBB1584090.1 flagella biosynthesis chaperone FliJ [Serratia sp. OS31]MBH2811077.1 flagella biosynthesis chaperone FliJ [Serratia liquefaciens]